MLASARIGAALAAVAVLTALLAPGSGAAPAPCVPDISPVDPDASESARCVAALLDSWKRDGLMGVGQQIDLHRRGEPDSPLRALEPLRPAVVGFDLGEFFQAAEYYDDDPVRYLIRLARSGVVLTATWHADNPVTGGPYDDRSWTRISQLLNPDSAASRTFWAQYDRLLVQIKRLQTADVALILKPFHEAAGGWFWWGKPRPAVYQRLFAEIQRRTYEAGVHNVLWAYAAAPQTWPGQNDPLELIPRHVDLVGVDVYDNETTDPVDRLPLQDYRLLSNRAPRIALTEVGPYDSANGDWNPRVITDTLRGHGLYAAFAMLWRDGGPSDARMQISSVTGGRKWLRSCPQGLCRLTP